MPIERPDDLYDVTVKTKNAEMVWIGHSEQDQFGRDTSIQARSKRTKTNNPG